MINLTVEYMEAIDPQLWLNCFYLKVRPQHVQGNDLWMWTTTMHNTSAQHYVRTTGTYIIPDMDWSDNDKEDTELTFWDVLDELRYTISSKSLISLQKQKREHKLNSWPP